MAIHYSGGFGRLYKKETGGTTFDIDYQLIETDQTKYTSKKWWGEFSTKQEIEPVGMYVIEFDDGRKGRCIVTINSERLERRRKGEKITSLSYCRFFGRGKLGRYF